MTKKEHVRTKKDHAKDEKGSCKGRKKIMQRTKKDHAKTKKEYANDKKEAYKRYKPHPSVECQKKKVLSYPNMWSTGECVAVLFVLNELHVSLIQQAPIHAFYKYLQNKYISVTVSGEPTRYLCHQNVTRQNT